METITYPGPIHKGFLGVNVGYRGDRKLLLQLPAGDEQRCHPSCVSLGGRQFRHPHRRRKT